MIDRAPGHHPYDAGDPLEEDPAEQQDDGLEDDGLEEEGDDGTDG